MNSLFSIDEDALKNAFGFDSSAMNNLGSSMDLSGLDLSKAFQMDGNSMDLSGMVNLDQVEINMGNMPQMNLGIFLRIWMYRSMRMACRKCYPAFQKVIRNM